MEEIIDEGGELVAKVIDSEHTKKFLTNLKWLEHQAQVAETVFGLVSSIIE